MQPLFGDLETQLVVCHLIETPERSATFYANGIGEANYWFEFSAARQTMSPNLSVKENERLFGTASSPFGHGHNYRARLTFRSGTKEKISFPSGADVSRCLRSLHSELDHKNLNTEVAGLTKRPMTTESIAQYVHGRITAMSLPVHRVRLHERDDFFAEYWGSGEIFLGMQMPFSAAHRLHAAGLSAAKNVSLYGKCNNPRGHGHLYLTEATIGGRYDERSGTLYRFASFQEAMKEGLQPWQEQTSRFGDGRISRDAVDWRKYRACPVAETKHAAERSIGAITPVGNGQQSFYAASNPNSGKYSEQGRIRQSNEKQPTFKDEQA